jgi:hypothetical protein
MILLSFIKIKSMPEIFETLSLTGKQKGEPGRINPLPDSVLLNFIRERELSSKNSCGNPAYKLCSSIKVPEKELTTEIKVRCPGVIFTKKSAPASIAASIIYSSSLSV